MKTILKIFCIATFTSFLFSCQKTSEFDNELAGIDLKSAHKGAVITVTPNGVDDTDNLKQAFADAAAAGPGTTIQLTEGNFLVNYIEVYNFQGTLVGAGREKTIVTLLPGIPMQAQLDVNQISAWWRMIGGDITISDMTFITPDGNLLKEGDIDPFLGKDLFSMFIFNHYNDLYYHPENPQNVVINSVNFYGGYDNPDDGNYWKTDHNVLIAVWVGVDYFWPADGIDYPLTKGNFVVNDCIFEHVMDGAEGFSLGEYAVMRVSSCRSNNCFTPFYFTANYNSKIIIANNTFFGTNGWCDIQIEDNDWGFLFQTEINPLKRCEYFVYGNTFNSSPSIPSIITNDHWVYQGPEDRLPMLIDIKNNVFKLAKGSNGISLNNSQDAVVRNNRFSGNCTTGITVNGFTLLDPDDVPFAQNVLIQGNNFSSLNSTVANIYLGEKSKDCTVVGSKTDGNVIDLGVNNKITGMKKGKPGLKIGPTIVDNHRMIKRVQK